MRIEDQRQTQDTRMKFGCILPGVVFQGSFFDSTVGKTYKGTFYRANGTVVQLDGQDAWGFHHPTRGKIHEQIRVDGYQPVHGRIVIERNA